MAFSGFRLFLLVQMLSNTQQR